MPRYFHYDRLNRLTAGQVLTLDKYPVPGRVFAGTSMHGEGHFRRANLDRRDTQIEVVWELVRRSNFPHAPSRATAVFACETLDGINAFKTKYGHGTDGTIWEIESETPGYRVDMSLLRHYDGDVAGMLGLANVYWNPAEHGGNPDPDEQIWEILVDPPVTVLRRVDPAGD